MFSSMEKFACDITERLSYHGRNSGISAVGERMDMFEKCDDDGNSYPGLLVSPAEIAVEGGLKTFLATSTVQSYIRRVFYNEIDIHRRFWVVSDFVYEFIFHPIALIIIDNQRKVKDYDNMFSFYSVRNFKKMFKVMC